MLFERLASFETLSELSAIRECVLSSALFRRFSFTYRTTVFAGSTARKNSA
jgi:hypothetical protein